RDGVLRSPQRRACSNGTTSSTWTISGAPPSARAATRENPRPWSRSRPETRRKPRERRQSASVAELVEHKMLNRKGSRGGANPRPLECDSSALPTELRPHRQVETEAETRL